eukprot:Rhum_TRINITY_DN8944_c0_g1::Rhum_TRINITY_DN8944_c0_g1_i1::g.30483::m.30483
MAVAAGDDTFRNARLRTIEGARLTQELMASLRVLVVNIEDEVPQLEERLLARLKRIGSNTHTQEGANQCYTNIKEEREECRGIELQLERLALKREKAAVLLAQLEENSSKQKGCRVQSLAALNDMAQQFRNSDTDVLFDENDFSLALNTSEVVKTKVCVEPLPASCASFKTGISALCPDISKRSRLFLGFTNGKVMHVSSGGGAFQSECPGHLYEILFLRVVVIRGTPYLASGSRDKCVKLTDIATKQIFCCLSHHSGCVVDLCVWDNVVYTTSLDGTISYWHLKRSSREGNLLEIHESISMSTFVSSSLFYVGTKSGRLASYWWCDTEKECRQLASWQGHRGYVSCMTYSDEQFLYTGGTDCKILVWDVVEEKEGVLIHTLSHHADTVLSISISHNRVLFSAGADALVCVWDINTGSLLHIISDHYHHVTGLCLVDTGCRDDNESDTDDGVKHRNLSALLDLPESLFEHPAGVSPEEANAAKARFRAEATTPPTPPPTGAAAVSRDASREAGPPPPQRVPTPHTDGISGWDGGDAPPSDVLDVSCIRSPQCTLSDTGNEPNEPPPTPGEVQQLPGVWTQTLITVSNDKAMLGWEVTVS